VRGRLALGLRWGAALLVALTLGCGPRRPPRAPAPVLRPGAALPSEAAPAPLRPDLSAPPLPLADPRATLIEVERRAHRLRAFEGSLDRRLRLDGREVRLRVRFALQRPGRLRYEYWAPVQQTLICDGETVWLRQGPQAGGTATAWTRRSLATLAPAERAALGLVPGYGFDPLGPLQVDAYRYSFVERGPTRVRIRLQPSGPRGARLPPLEVELDPVRGVVRQVATLGTGAGPPHPVVQRWDDYQELISGVWLPRSASLRWILADGQVLEVQDSFAGLRPGGSVSLPPAD